MIYRVLFLILVGLGNLDAADYTVSTLTPAEELALGWEAKRANKSNAAVLHELVKNYLRDLQERRKEAHEKVLRQGYEKASPTDKAIIEGITGSLP